ncbi:M15 family metallopeptidase [Leucobacter aridicollis]|uniref:D-alanyl-D-alanine carboxypeptidase n=1 Tax=Leucobacter aridicollis TaxID=283878 RepID=A0A852RHB1_9MICO|nr:M15 family metallopeptidase [Leucobacter aridicollis]MBL3681378.1 D-alanyl-D-alanine carboxypeptidase family protein [Leucobacter aridicollis]NYD27594.1 D-alanyl-D-alanine carboxypeptidase [Leucobacter aridicollis]
MNLVPFGYRPTTAASTRAVRRGDLARRAGWTAAAAFLGLGLLAGCAQSEPASPSPDTATTSPAPEPTPDPAPAQPEFDRSAQSIDDPASLWVISNKSRPLDPVDWAPSDLVATSGVENEFDQPLREPAARAVEALIGAAADAGHSVWIISAYRDYGTQVALYDGYVDRDGAAAADRYSARPGHSEHQTGLVVDLDDHGDCYLDGCFGDTPAGKWLAENAADYGFVIRYPEGKEQVTGFMPEPWHFRFVGTELALEMRDQGVTTLEEFFGLPAAPDYP